MITRRFLVALTALVPGLALADQKKPKRRKKKARKPQAQKEEFKAMQGTLRMDRASFDEMPVPPDELIGQVVYVDAETGQPGFFAFGRVNAAGDPEWYIEADEFQIPIDSAEQFESFTTSSTAAVPVDLSQYKQVMFGFKVETAATPGDVKLEYSTDFSTWNDLTSEISLASTGEVWLPDWEVIPSGARALCIIRGTAFNGDGTDTAFIYFLVAKFRR